MRTPTINILQVIETGDLADEIEQMDRDELEQFAAALLKALDDRDTVTADVFAAAIAKTHSEARNKAESA